ncbi:RNA exonuclease 5-like isoform X1 [Macrobrachium nipponense]|uniref:RNA exonuclease 5-like isoform X1 n=1 Tax=Macrobrachium nipponense TaxID=159736 RepID=UPI0030C8015C
MAQMTKVTQKNEDLPPSDSFDRRQLLLTHSDLYLFKYPVPVLSSYLENGFVYSKDKYKKVKPSSPMYGIDCEMCLSEENKLELGSISVVNEDLKLIYHKLVKPEKKIVNYLTQFSGLTKEMLESVTTTVYDVQNDLRSLLPPDAILVGHSLNNDLKAMKIMHPYVIDTAVAYNLTFNKRRLSSLQVLTKLFLERQIQMNPGGHDPTEDAVATLELIQLKLKKGYAFGNVIEGYRLQNGLNIHPQASLNRSPENYFNIFQHAVASRLKTAILMTPASAIGCHHILESVPKDKVEVHILKENKVLSQKAANIAMSKDFTFLYMKTNEINTESKEKHKEDLKKLDKRLRRVFNGACQRSLIMYIFTGSSENEACDESSNGLFMCSIKSIKDNSLSVT